MYGADASAFLFNNRANTRKITKFPVKRGMANFAVATRWDDLKPGPNFGGGDLGGFFRHDLLSWCNNAVYDIPGGPDALAGAQEFCVNEVEVFAV